MKKIKRIISIIVLAVIFTATTMAQSGLTPWDGTVATGLGAGEGTEASPYLITNASQMAYMAVQVDGGEKYTGKYFRLENDLDLGGALPTPSQWFAIGGNNKMARSFYGIFDGNNKSIYNIYINKPDINYLGLFGYVYNVGVVKNLTIASGSIKGKQYIGGISGFAYGNIENCRNFANIESVSGISYCGGIVGSTFGLVKDCYNVGTVKGLSMVGGITGRLAETSITTLSEIRNCFNVGDINVSGQSVKSAGIAGELATKTLVTNSYNMGNISYTGGASTGKIGGIVGESSGTITSCYNCGDIQSDAAAMIGGIAGNSYKATMTNCFYDKQMCSQLTAVHNTNDTETVKGMLTKDFIKSTQLDGFSSDNWIITENLYPRLKIFETNKLANLYAVPIILNSTSETRYDIRSAVKSSFTVSTALSSVWNVEQGTSVTINGVNATVVRPDNGDDNVKLKVTTDGVSRELAIVVYQKPVTVTIVQPDNGLLKVMDGEIELVSPASVESNSGLTLIAIPSDEYMLDSFIVNGNDIEGDKVTITGNTTLTARFTIVAPPGPWDGAIATEFGGGSGKDIAPYLIKSANQLAFLAQQVNSGTNNYKGVYFKLVYDLDMGGNVNNWIPIGKRNGDLENTSFMGFFDGNGKEIKNLYINATDIVDVGLFGQAGLGSEIKNLGLAADCSVKSVSTTPESIQCTGGIIGNTRGPLKNCWNKGTVSGTGNVGGIFGSGREAIWCYNAGNVSSTTGDVGGIAAMTMVTTITGCYNSGKVSGNQSTGAIVGFGNSSSFIGCYNIGEVVGAGDNSTTGGIAGMIGGSTRVSEIRGCANFGLVSTTSKTVGGIVGNVSNGNVSDCYNAGVISGKSYIGGIAGRYNGMAGAISGCYSIGEIVGTPGDPNIGGILGYLDGGGFLNSYYDKQIVPIEKAVGNRIDAENRRGVITTFLTTATAIDGFDVRYWTFTDGVYPRLTKFKDLECSKLNASPATLHAVGETNFESIKAVRNNFTVNTANAVVWTVEAGTTVAIAAAVATVTPKADADEQVTIKATLGELSKEITMTVPKLAYRLVIDPSTNGSVVVKDAAGEVIVSGTELTPNQVITLTPTADEGYHFTKWWDNDVTNPRTITVSSSLAVSATFEINSYTLTATASEHGEITPEGVTTVTFGENLTYTIMPEVGYTTETLLVDGASVTVANNYTFNHINANHTISATFKIKSYTITATAGENGTITPNGATTVEHGANQAYTIKANDGFRIAKLTVDGATVPTAATYTFNSVVANHTIDAVFEKQTFTITASSNEFGTITPAGEIEVIIGEDKEFIMIANDGYKIKDVLVDDVSVLKDIVNSRYTFKAVEANHTISVVFDEEVGVNDIADSNITVWANRNTVYCRSSYNNELNVELIDITGRVISQTSFTTQTEIQVNNKGIYVVRIADGSEFKSVKKVVIN